MGNHVPLDHELGSLGEGGLPVGILAQTQVGGREGVQIGVELLELLVAHGVIVVEVVLHLGLVGVEVVAHLALHQVLAHGLLGQVVPESVDLGVLQGLGVLLHQEIPDVRLELIQQGAVGGVELLLGLVLHGLLHELPVILGEGVLDGVLHHHVEDGVLTRQLLGVLLGEGDVYLGGAVLGGLVGNNAHQPVLKAGDEGAGAQTQLIGGLVIPVGAALKLLAVHEALIVNVGIVARLQGLILDHGGAVDGGAVLEEDARGEIILHVLVLHLEGVGNGQGDIHVVGAVDLHVGGDHGVHVVIAGDGGDGLGLGGGAAARARFVRLAAVLTGGQQQQAHKGQDGHNPK